MKNHNFVLLAFSLLLFVYGCSNSSSVQDSISPSVQSLFPLKAGNEWVYLSKEYDTLGVVRGPIDTIRLKILEATTFNGIPAFKYQVIGQDDDTSYIFYNHSTEVNIAGSLTATPDVLLHSSLKLGESVTLLDTVYDFGESEKETFTFKQSKATSIPAGTFFGFQFEDKRITITTNSNEINTRVSNYTYGMNIGLLLDEEYYSKSNGGLYLSGSLELYSYHLN